MRTTSIALLFLSTGLAWCSCQHPPSEALVAAGQGTQAAGQAIAPTCRDVALVLTKKAAGTLRFEAVLQNHGTTPVELMIPSGGSTGLPNPTLHFELTPAELDTSTGRFGFITVFPLAEDDFIVLEPGKARGLRWLDDAPLPARSNTYTIRLTYRNDPLAKVRDPSLQRPELLARVATTTPCELTSNAVTFDYQAPERRAPTAPPRKPAR